MAKPPASTGAASRIDPVESSPQVALSASAPNAPLPPRSPATGTAGEGAAPRAVDATGGPQVPVPVSEHPVAAKTTLPQGGASEGGRLGLSRVREWTLLAEVGRGGMGVVYRARHDMWPGDFAIKAILPEVAGHPEMRRRFLREARLMGQLPEHPNIIRCLPPFEQDGRVYLPMEFLVGKTLDEAMDERLEPWPLTDIDRVLRPVAAALGHAHAAGIVHRDVKPSNIFLCDDGTVKLLDLGLARSVHEPPSLNSRGGHRMGGTPYFLPPEVLSGRGAGPAADIWALGVIAYELLTAHSPFDPGPGGWPETAGGMIKALMGALERPVPPPGRWASVPAPVDEFIMRCLEKSPERRIPNGSAFLDQWRLTLVDVKEAAHASAAEKRRRAIWAFGGVAVMLAVMAFALSQWGPPPGSRLKTTTAPSGFVAPPPPPPPLVRVADFARCVAMGPCSGLQGVTTNVDRPDCHWGANERDERPMNCITVEAAAAYCAWAGGRLSELNLPEGGKVAPDTMLMRFRCAEASR